MRVGATKKVRGSYSSQPQVSRPNDLHAFRLAGRNQGIWPPKAARQLTLSARWGSLPYTRPYNHRALQRHDIPVSLKMTPHGRS